MRIKYIAILIFGIFFFGFFAVFNYRAYNERIELNGVDTKVKVLSYIKSSKRKNRICVSFQLEKRCLNVSDSFLVNIDKKDSVNLLYDIEKDVLYDGKLSYKSNLYAAHFMLLISLSILFYSIVFLRKPESQHPHS